MTHNEMVEEFLCPGCVSGSDTACGKFEPREAIPGSCKSHCLGTRLFPAPGLIALGMPKGFNRPGYCPEVKDGHHHMLIRLWTKGEAGVGYNMFNVPVWALEKDGFLFVRGMSPRVGELFIDVFEGGQAAEICPQAINMTTHYEEYD